VLQTLIIKGQIANYINNGSFEEHYNCNFLPYLGYSKYWRAIDSINGSAGYASPCYTNVPYNGFGFQYARSGNSYALTDFYCSTCSPNLNRGYMRNRLKSKLVVGKTYCVKFWANIGNNSTYGIANIGAYFGDNSLDTITQCNIPLTYLNPQVEGSTIVTDTLNWTLITGTFVANGTEKHCVIGNFRSDAATTKTLINSTYLPNVFCTVNIDDVSCIPIDLPAYAGSDVFGIPGNTVYIGRPQDVGIDEACTWYNITNTTTPIANAAGITITVGVSSQTYIVKQDICGNIKYDTVAVYASAVGMVSLSGVEDWGVSVYPNPVKDLLYVEVSHAERSRSVTSETSTSCLGGRQALSLTNALGQVIKEEVLRELQKPIEINVKDLQEGIYFLQIKSEGKILVNKKFVIER
jgi:hypothetical protein